VVVTFCLEVEEGGHLSAFMIASQEEDLVFEAECNHHTFLILTLSQ
jgi:hypothetical protein